MNAEKQYSKMSVVRLHSQSRRSVKKRRIPSARTLVSFRCIVSISINEEAEQASPTQRAPAGARSAGAGARWAASRGTGQQACSATAVHQLLRIANTHFQKLTQKNTIGKRYACRHNATRTHGYSKLLHRHCIKRGAVQNVKGSARCALGGAVGGLRSGVLVWCAGMAHQPAVIACGHCVLLYS